VGQETIAGFMRTSLRAVQNPIGSLEERGWVLVRHRELKVRAADGRRFYGCRDAASVHLPAVASELIGDQLRETADRKGAGSAPKDAPPCVQSEANECMAVRPFRAERTNGGPPKDASGAWASAHTRLGMRSI
jgi:hypothetical protein